MRVTVKEAKEAWKSPDGKVVIYDCISAEPIPEFGGATTFKTRSHKLAQAIGQSVEVVITTSSTGKTYLKPYSPEHDGPQAQASFAPQPSAAAPQGMAEFAVAVAQFSAAVDKLVKALPNWDETDKIAESGDVVPTQLSDETVAELMGGTIVDDL